ncbi:site-specific integrase [Desulfonema ishimotonii]|uniref:Site-specific integrase n=1 Tax=Desulfonema ishimotonii TaxID=45657 RepID=A0A401G167_9BACT|nr:site-specific integrase [Desulfonema ishimotonii]GBC62951.1 site-specific integrase [Desulfonema ishimotonii]
MSKWKTTKYPGVRYREHESRKHGVKKDRYFSVRYQRNGKQREEGLGWASAAGWTEKKVIDALAEIRENIRRGQGPQSFKEAREGIRQDRIKDAAQEEEDRLNSITFGQFFRDSYLPDAKQNKKERSWQTEKNFFRMWISPTIGKKRLSEVSVADLERIRNKMLYADLSPRTVQYCLATIRQIYNRAKTLRIFTGENPATLIKTPKIDNKRQRFLTREEADRLLGHLKYRSLQTHDMALLSLHCGLRAGEIFSLTWDCIDFENDQIFLRDTKNGKNRYAYMTGPAREMLMNRRGKKASGYVFKSRNGKKITEMSGTYKRAVEAVGLNDNITDYRQKVVFHTLRHTFASWHVQDGIPLFTVAKLMGHSSTAMTERYSHLAPNDMKNAVKRFDDNLEKESKVIDFQDHILRRKGGEK